MPGVQSILVFAAFTLIAPTFAYPSSVPIEARSDIYSDWRAPVDGDVRSPCPGLNSLANHGILPRNGRGISIPILTKALQTGYNVSPDFSIAIGGFGLDTTPNASTSFDLNNLAKHGVIEHDGSLSRADFNAGKGNNTVFNQALFNTVLQQVPAGQLAFTFANAAAGRWARVSASKATDPNFIYTPKELVLSYGETSLYLSVMGNPITGLAPKSFVKIFFEQERLPYAEGWRPSLIPTSLVTLGVMIESLQASSPPAALLSEGFIITQSTVNAAFSGGEVGPLIPCALGGTGCIGA